MDQDEAADEMRKLVDKMADILVTLHEDQRYRKSALMVVLTWDGKTLGREAGMTFVDNPKTLKALLDELESD